MDRFTQSLFLLLLLSSAVNQGLSSKPSFWTAPHTHALAATADGTEKAYVPLELSGRAGVRRLTGVDCMGGSERQQVIHAHVTPNMVTLYVH